MPRRDAAGLEVDPEPLLGSVFATGRVVAARCAYVDAQVFERLFGFDRERPPRTLASIRAAEGFDGVRRGA